MKIDMQMYEVMFVIGHVTTFASNNHVCFINFHSKRRFSSVVNFIITNYVRNFLNFYEQAKCTVFFNELKYLLGHAICH